MGKRSCEETVLPVRTLARLAAAALLAAVLVGTLAAGGAWGRSVPAAAARPAAGKAPKVTKQPASASVEEGQSASFEAAASGSPAPTVQWEVSSDGGVSWSAVEGANTGKLTIASAKAAENGEQLRAVFKNSSGQAVSKAATLSVKARTAPKVTLEPSNATVEAGQSASFEAAASGSPAPTVQWEVSSDGGVSWSAIEGASADRLTIADAQLSQSGYEYRAVFTNVVGEAPSSPAELVVQEAPRITEQPASATVEAGHSASFEAAASGSPAPTVQWEVSSDGGASWSAIEGAGSEQLTIAEAQGSQSGWEYRAAFTNAAGKAISEAAKLTVTTHDYTVTGWGENAFGQLGDGSVAVSVDAPVGASGLQFVTAVAGGQHHSLALLSDGTVMAWGENEYGQLGDGEFAPRSEVPVQVRGLSGVSAIAAGANFSLALLANGTVMAWGGDEVGQLGDGETEESVTPVTVKGLSGVVAIAAGGRHALALLANGTVKAWGEDEMGELGNGSLKGSETPVTVKALSGVEAIAAGGEHSLALLTSGAVEGWGSDADGQIGPNASEGEGEERHSDVPVLVSGVSGASAIAAGQRHSLALLGDGTVAAWGENRFGELGDGELTRAQETPVAVSALSGVSAIAAGGEHSLALLAGGTVMTWGEDKFGELGNGTAGEGSDVPVEVSGLAEVAGIGAGSLHDLAFGEPLPSISGVSPDAGSTAGGTEVTISGEGFSETSAVSFGGVPATSFSELSPNTIVAVAPAHAAGTVDVSVTTVAGSSASTEADRFTYAPAPAIKKISPKSSPAAGGKSVTITGSGFSEASAVSFGGEQASFVVNSSSSITAVAPAHAPGAVTVTVTGPYGTSAITSKSKFKYKK
ncbi:MAG TPA: IPT/TIG domain-containing protein [Solirubrobacteraceae bacterium]|nr:IPT/TIG domain-containing protein [Solirubrobacteraceae bacterium]